MWREETLVVVDPDVADLAARLLEDARRAELTRGRDLELFKLACLVVASRLASKPLTPAEIEALAGDRRRKLRVLRLARLIERELNLIPKLTTEAYIARLTEKLGLGWLAGEAINMYRELDRAVAVKNPNPWIKAAVILHLTAQKHGVKLAMSRIATAIGVSKRSVFQYKAMLARNLAKRGST
jgi:transcription initiation factor TFIIIB Brf1 subunit/transcription initiation factor TFIIB